MLRPRRRLAREGRGAREARLRRTAAVRRFEERSRLARKGREERQVASRGRQLSVSWQEVRESSQREEQPVKELSTASVCVRSGAEKENTCEDSTAVSF